MNVSNGKENISVSEGKMDKSINQNKMTWRRTTSYLLPTINKVITVKAICEVRDNRPIGNENVIFSIVGDPSIVNSYTPDRIIHVSGISGLLYLVDTNIYFEIENGTIVNGDVTRNRENIMLTTAMVGQRKVRVGQTSLKMKSDNAKTLDVSFKAWNDMGLDETNMPLALEKKILSSKKNAIKENKNKNNNENNNTVNNIPTNKVNQIQQNVDSAHIQVEESTELPGVTVGLPKEVLSETDTSIRDDSLDNEITMFAVCLRGMIDARDYADPGIDRPIQNEQNKLRKDIVEAFGMTRLPITMPQSCEREVLGRDKYVIYVFNDGFLEKKLEKGKVVVKVNADILLACVDLDA